MTGETAANGRTAVLVGYGPRTTARARRPRTDTVPAPAPRAAPPPVTAARVSAAAVGRSAAQAAGEVSVLAKPPVRKLAKDLGVDLATVDGTGRGGTITRADVEAATSRPAPPPVVPGAREHRVPVKGVRKHTAAAMVASAFTAPHVTEFLTVDVTPTMELRDKVAALPEFAGVKVGPLLFVARALLLAVRRSPELNSTWDEAAQEIVVKDDVHLGIAAATPRGLLVPNVKDAGRLSLRELAGALADLTATARAGRTTPADLSGGTITITNVGVFGVDAGTPILNPGEAGILCVGQVAARPWVVDGELAVRQMTTLSLSFDHRVVDGEVGSRFLADVGRVLSEPEVALAWT